MRVRSQTLSPARAVAFYRPRLRAEHFAPRYWATWIGLTLLRLMAPLPLLLTRAVGGTLGLAMLAANGKRRHVARVNLRLCFPEMTEHARAALLRRHFIVYGQSFTDIAHLAWSSPRRLERMTRWRGLERYRALSAGHRRVILLAPHFVGMNFSGALLARERAVFSLVKPLRNAVLDRFVERARTRFGAGVIARRQGLRPAIRALDQGHAFFYAPDEDFGSRHTLFAPFFGLPRATLPTLGRLARSHDAAVVPLLVRLLPRARGYEVTLAPPLDDFPSGDVSRDAVRMNRAIEQSVRSMPEQYFWTFKLFKTRPAGEPNPYR